MQIPKELLLGCRQKDEKIQQQLYLLCFSQMIRLGLRYVRNEQDAADILNRAFFKVFTKIDQFKGDHQQFGGWIKRIMVNEALDFVRAVQKKQNRQILGPVPDHKLDQSIKQMDETQNLIHLLNKLPELTATVFNLFAMEGYAHKEISEMLNITISNSKWHLHSARKQLQQLLQKNAVL